MALDVFHQVLKRLYELAGGSPSQMVSTFDVLKQEKLFGSAEMILNKLHTESWITDASKKDHVYVTIWGIEEVHRMGAPAPAPAAAVPEAATPAAPKPAEPKPAEPKNAGALREAATKARDLATTLEELASGAGGTGAQRKAKAKKAVAAVTAAVEEAFE
jgi:pyruvate/2-oxoglutarate dehydrogenase complex dihydrolipoamide acyltransferase (E2) component